MLQTNQRTDPKSDEYFFSNDRKGGPTDPLHGFPQLYETIIKDRYENMEMKDYPLYVELRKFSRDDKSEYQKESDPQLQAQLNDRNDDGDQELIPYEPRKLKNDGKSY